MSLIDDVKDYECWLRTKCDVVEEGLRKKHDRMAKDAFKFFRATCFRFARKVRNILTDLAEAPTVPAVGDAHIENWGTWRDAEGRLVWGVNDFDEAADLPYTYDLLRLAVSAPLAPGLPGSNRERTAAILVGYRDGLSNPRPRFVDDEFSWMQSLVLRPAARPGAFREELGSLEATDPPAAVAHALQAALPKGTTAIRFGAWQRGGGSLGRPRFVATGIWRCGPVVREAKALVPSAWSWASEARSATGPFRSMAAGRFRAPDPFLTVRSKFVIRRIAPDSAKIDLADEDALAYGPDLLAAMGADLAAIHLGGATSAQAILRDLDARDWDWLRVGSREAANAVRRDFAQWKDSHAGGSGP